MTYILVSHSQGSIKRVLQETVKNRKENISVEMRIIWNIGTHQTQMTQEKINRLDYTII